jgi:hypothetical protein
MSMYHTSVELMLNQMIREGARVLSDSGGLKILAKAEDARGAYEMILYVDTHLYRTRKDEYGRVLSKEQYVCPNGRHARWEQV